MRAGGAMLGPMAIRLAAEARAGGEGAFRRVRHQPVDEEAGKCRSVPKVPRALRQESAEDGSLASGGHPEAEVAKDRPLVREAGLHRATVRPGGEVFLEAPIRRMQLPGLQKAGLDGITEGINLTAHIR